MTLTARWSALVLLFTPVVTWALGLGDIELRSALNQPLDAEIQLVFATPEELSSLRVALASQETFDRYGLDRPAYLGEIIFDVGTDNLERPIISMSSRGPMAEPLVTVLVEASWSRGRLLREYTVLLDPPVLLPLPAAAPTVQAAQAGAPDVTQPAAATNRPAAAPVPAPVPASATLMAQPVEPVQAATPSPGTYGPVRSAETLWAIAEQHRPNGVTMDQMVVALYRANPQVFDGNMNTLHLGSILRIPQLAELSEMTAAAATEEALRQAADWQTGTDTQARLRLVTPDSAANADITTGGSTAAATTEIAVLEGELGTALNELSESQRLLEIRDQQLQDLQAQLAAAVTPPAAVTRVVVPPIQPSLLSRVLGWLTSPILLIGLGLLALLGTAVWYLRFRRQDTDDVTGRWEALEADLGDDTDSLEATARLREPVNTEETIDIDEQNVVVEGEEAASELLSDPLETSAAETKSWPDSESDISDAASGETLTIGIPPEEESTEDTISSQTIIDLDIGDFSTPDDDATLLAAGNDDASLLALGDQDATMLAPGVDDDLWDGTQRMEQSPDEDLGLDDSSADVSADAGSNIDLDLDDLTSALEESDTVEQPMAQSVGSDLSVGIGSADVTLDIGSETPTGDAASAESPRPLDPHTMTMTEVGTKLDLARAYVDMGEPDGARRILEEVLEEGDDAQQKEAQGIIDAL